MIPNEYILSMMRERIFLTKKQRMCFVLGIKISGPIGGKFPCSKAPSNCTTKSYLMILGVGAH
jgi:hypothetical protein